MYSFSCLNRGESNLSVIRPSFVIKINPCESLSSLPTGNTFIFLLFSSLKFVTLKISLSPASSLLVKIPIGLLYAI
ncbi:hypothetical protein A2903_03125 [Candidatus Nomurabacteria bacterium RIFCSPLOWO2_01_FULL_33_17]|uniref:Uncharacterized protein n=1 Tax=Candidatus Nomurabacteria bacterium RIFCSPLOWO2_01_FULL_33_17 TaxID=1801764 RepID=A0A1F6WQY2_9BACT|nr:MAG: hypothetical protein A2903_03125 [Candidatus Nomurabacteria bacterium RIFCSPLOWO2_01_FULL_33_17]